MVGAEDANDAMLDVAILGGGLAGACAAHVLARAGYRVALVDLHDAVQPCFKAEKLEPGQAATLDRLGLLDVVAAGAAPIDLVISAARGREIDHAAVRHYGILYHDMVNALRARLPETVATHVARVDAIEAGAAVQRVRLSTGLRLTARLLVLATGLGGLPGKVGIGRRTIRRAHSLSIGFTLALPRGQRAAPPSLTYYGERVEDRIDYLSLFPIPGGLRANLFAYRDAREAWARDFAEEPAEALAAALPGLARFLPEFRVRGDVLLRPVDLEQATGYAIPGAVLLGDAFQTSCPATGTGLTRLLGDVELLCKAYAPQWLATPGMGAEKIAAFYADPAKQARDWEALRWAEYRRSAATEPGLRWEVHRRQVLLRRRLRAWMGRAPGGKIALKSFGDRRKFRPDSAPYQPLPRPDQMQ